MFTKLGGALILALCVALAGCASLESLTRQRQVASVLSFLFPGADQPPPSDKVAVLDVPIRIGVAFVPDQADAKFRLSETDRLKLAGQVRDAFARYPFVREIEAVSSLYLEPGGGFANLDRVASLLRLDAIALISYDQVQHSGASGWSFLYWTGIGAYVIEGDRYDVLTAVETTVFDIRSRRLLMRAAGMSTLTGTSTLKCSSALSAPIATTTGLMPPPSEEQHANSTDSHEARPPSRAGRGRTPVGCARQVARSRAA